MKTRIMKFWFSGMMMCFGAMLGRGVNMDKGDIVHELIMEGRHLTDLQAMELESKLTKKPDDIASFTRLLGYYALQKFIDPKIKEKRTEYIFWLMTNHPDAAVLGEPEGQLTSQPENSAEMVKCWQEQVAKNPENLKILVNAAKSLSFTDSKTSIQYLEKICQLEPKKAEWHYLLAHVYELRAMRNAPEDEITKFYEKAYEFYEIACHQGNSQEKCCWLPNLAKAAIRVNEIEEAEKIADEMLTLAQSHKDNGSMIYFGNMIKGLVALRHDDVTVAEKSLLKSGETVGSPILNSFGPNMMLADELLTHGRDAVVLEFLSKCGNFWIHKNVIDAWTAEINAGKTPNFGGNLFY